MKHSNFRGQNINGQDFSGQDLTGSNFRDANIAKCNFKDATLHFCNFKDSIQDGANFKGAKVRFSVGINDISKSDNETEPVKEDDEIEMEAYLEKDEREREI